MYVILLYAFPPHAELPPLLACAHCMIEIQLRLTPEHDTGIMIDICPFPRYASNAAYMIVVMVYRLPIPLPFRPRMEKSCGNSMKRAIGNLAQNMTAEAGTSPFA